MKNFSSGDVLLRGGPCDGQTIAVPDGTGRDIRVAKPGIITLGESAGPLERMQIAIYTRTRPDSAIAYFVSEV